MRIDLERIQGRLDYLRDRVTYATIAVAIAQTPRAETPPAPASYQATFATGIHAVSMIDVREQSTNGYVGTGLSLRFPRSTGESGRGFALDVDVMRSCCGNATGRGAWAYDVLTGLDLFSDSLESGHRKWLNPFLGLRLGVRRRKPGWTCGGRRSWARDREDACRRPRHPSAPHGARRQSGRSSRGDRAPARRRPGVLRDRAKSEWRPRNRRSPRSRVRWSLFPQHRCEGWANAPFAA